LNTVTNDSLNGAVLDANVVYHTALAETYDETQPHFRPENEARVRTSLQTLAEQTPARRLLDLGCGTGFVMNLAAPYFDNVVGADITQAMLDRVPDLPNLETRLVDTSDLPFEDLAFDVCTAYSFLHHLSDLEPTLREAARVLKPGGILWASADPNRLFWEHMKSLEGRQGMVDFVQREVDAVDGMCEEIADATGLTTKQVTMAEFQKMELGGFDPDEISDLLRSLGFGVVRCDFEWFLGQGKVLHEQSAAAATEIESYLQSALPATRHLFKYVSFTARKER